MTSYQKISIKKLKNKDDRGTKIWSAMKNNLDNNIRTEQNLCLLQLKYL